MKSILRYFSRVVVLIALLVLSVITYGTTAKAASDCFDGLKPADCQLLNEASANLGNVKTFLLDYTLSFKATGLPDGAISLSAQGSGPVDLSEVSGSDVSAALSKIVFSNKLFSSLIAGARSSAGSMDIRQVDGTLYVKGDQATKNQWYSLSMEKILPAILSQSSMNRLTLADFSPDIVANVRRSGIAAVPGVLHGSVQAGRFVDGQATTQFTLDYNIAALLQYFSKPANREQLRQYLSRSGMQYSDTDLDTVLEGFSLLMPTAKNTKLQFVSLVGKKDHLYHGFGLNLTSIVDADLVSLFARGTNAKAKPINVTGKLTVTLSQVGKPVTVKSVDNATDITRQTLSLLPTAPGSSPADSSQASTDIDAFIPDTVETRFEDIPSGATDVSSLPEAFPRLGDPSAPVRITQISSYGCSFCGNYYEEKIVPILDDIKAGRAQYIFIPITLTGEFDPTPGTTAAYCAFKQDKFWQMHDLLFDWQTRYGEGAGDTDRLNAGAKELGLNMSQFKSCMSGAEAKDFIAVANDYFHTLHLTGTPTVYANDQQIHPTTDSSPDESDLHKLINQLAGGKA